MVRLALGSASSGSLAARTSDGLRRIQDHPVLAVPGRMQGSFFRLEVIALQSAVTSSLVGMALTVYALGLVEKLIRMVGISGAVRYILDGPRHFACEGSKRGSWCWKPFENN